MAINPNKAVKAVSLSDEEQLDILANGGSIPSGSDTYTADESTVYLTPKKPTVVTGSSAPTTSTVADFVGQFYLDTTTTKLYQCTAIVSGTPNTYTWTEVGGSSGKYLHKVQFRRGSSSSDYQVLEIHVITTRSTAYTTVADLRTDLLSMGYTDNTLNYGVSVGGSPSIQPVASRLEFAYGIKIGSVSGLSYAYQRIEPVTTSVTINNTSYTMVTGLNYTRGSGTRSIEAIYNDIVIAL